jgi:hypothetical protein
LEGTMRTIVRERWRVREKMLDLRERSIEREDRVRTIDG